MFQNLAVGSALVALSVLIHTGGLILIGALTPWLAVRLRLHHHNIGRTLVMTATVMGILVILTIEVWTWALAYLRVGATPDFKDALYISTSMFSTVGGTGSAGIYFDPHWRLMAALESINGFLMIGWCTAFLVRASTRHGPFRGEDF
jgi:hypothetical protein